MHGRNNRGRRESEWRNRDESTLEKPRSTKKAAANNDSNRRNTSRAGDRRGESQRGSAYPRLKWSPPPPPSEAIPSPDCPLCGKPIRDMASAISPKSTGGVEEAAAIVPAHFECVLQEIGKKEKLERGDSIAYIGGGRFGVVRFVNPHEGHRFEIKKIFEWEAVEQRAPWRKTVSAHYSAT